MAVAASCNPINFQLVGGRSARFSTADFRLPDGRSLEGVGITPTYPNSWTLADFHEGRDPDLEATNIRNQIVLIRLLIYNIQDFQKHLAVEYS